eukprot:gnl/TRDRNA2_/TRDRNA2_141744_c0_seq1.p1 gnl/TRDRNA2_/TRDRNA2_141744_c0~~gnl/TRDRNA2_/TRDRNA2_141744_c0_seq1.p1  ORF type:complete len:236 (+),score=34.70 gnl/TRDRNA2_/TRDRNA2_141744_c0_seq1:51-758(+)
MATLADAVLALEDNTGIATLDLCAKALGDLEAKRLAKALMRNSTLTTLNLGGNSIMSQGVTWLAMVLEQNSTLTILNVAGNMIGDEGAERVATALEHNSTLTTLNLAGNIIGQQGVERLAKALEHNTTLTSLLIAGNSIGIQAQEERIATALERNRHVLVLTVSCESQVAKRCAITCTNMGGSQVALLDMKPHQTVAVLRKRITEKLGHRCNLRLVREDGALLDDSEVAVGDCLL